MAIQTAEAFSHGIHRDYKDVVIAAAVGAVLLLITPAKREAAAALLSVESQRQVYTPTRVSLCPIQAGYALARSLFRRSRSACECVGSNRFGIRLATALVPAAKSVTSLGHVLFGRFQCLITAWKGLSPASEKQRQPLSLLLRLYLCEI
jgi:hypothetical protein